MIEPALQGEAFLADVAAHRGADRGCRIWWLGQSGFLVHWRDHFLLLDPYLSDSLTEKYAGTDKPHERMTWRVVDPERLDMVEVVTSSHNHTDHLDAATLLPLRRANPALRLVIPEANRAFVAQRLGCEPDWPEGLTDGEWLEAGPFRLHAVASAHEQLDRTADGLYPYLGYIVEVGGIRIYHPGDTVLYDGLVEKVKAFAPDVALLPINGSLPERQVPGNLWGREAALLSSEIGAKLVIPCHYHTFEFNSVTPDEFVEHCGRLQQRYHLLRHGEGVDIPPREA
jgi:L-ascorbate metabolism protein UlaG (beta-lactamase superfamily)